jgi:hypothetical protein
VGGRARHRHGKNGCGYKAGDAVVIDVRGLPRTAQFTAYAARGNDTVALLTAASNNTGVIPDALAFFAFFANNYDEVILRPT